MKVRDVMIAPVVTASPETTYEAVAALLREHHVSGVPIVDQSGALVGVVSEKDLFRALFPLYEEFLMNPEIYADQEEQENEVEAIRARPIKDYMTRNVITIDADARVLHAGGLMLAHNIHRLPVMDNGKLVGIITREDIYGTILKKHLGN
jgi:CBS domain-containing protein